MEDNLRWQGRASSITWDKIERIGLAIEGSMARISCCWIPFDFVNKFILKRSNVIIDKTIVRAHHTWSIQWFWKPSTLSSCSQISQERATYESLENARRCSTIIIYDSECMIRWMNYCKLKYKLIERRLYIYKHNTVS